MPADPWVCPCHERPYIHATFDLLFTQEQYRLAWEDAEKICRTYEVSGKSVYRPDPKWVYRGTLAERVIADHFGIWHTPYADVGEPHVGAASDVEYGIEMRATGHWRVDRQNELCIALWDKDRGKIPKGIWVLASVRDETSEVIYWGYRIGKTIRLTPRGTTLEWTTAYGVKRPIALIFPDELGPMSRLVAYIERRQVEDDYPRSAWEID